MWTNGSSTIGLHREDPNIFREVPDLPTATQTLADMLNQPWTIDDLQRENILVVERTSLKDVILNMEDLVLANAGVDAFEEVFKLIYAKLFDEARAARAATGDRLTHHVEILRIEGSSFRRREAELSQQERNRQRPARDEDTE